MPVLTRTNQILEHALNSVDTPVIFKWPMLENRPALRIPARMAQIAGYREDDLQSMEYANRLPTINLMDNHGVRTLMMKYLLRQNQNEGAIELAKAVSIIAPRADLQYLSDLACELFRKGLWHHEDSAPTL